MNAFIKHAVRGLVLACAIAAPGLALAHGDGEMTEDAAPVQGKSFGHGADPATAMRTVIVTMNDGMRFEPDHIDVRQGEVLRIHVINQGRAEHEFVLGDREELKAHAQMMKQMPGMVHREANTIRLAPGKEGDVVWAFTEAGRFLFVCQVPGHWEAGMEGSLTVRPADSH